MNENPAISKFWKFIESLPVALPAALAAASLGITSLFLIGQFESVLIAVLALAFAIPAFVIILMLYLKKKPNPEAYKERRLFDSLMIVFVLGWALFNFSYVAQSTFIDRDPGIYTVTGKWLSKEDETNVKAENVFGSEPGLIARSGGIWNDTAKDAKTEDTTRLQPQGMHLFPALLGIGGRLGGDAWMFRTNVVIGAIALLAVYGFGRLIMKPRWAALATAILGASLPFIYFSRDTYTEPLAVVFTFAALSLAWISYKQLPKVNYWLWMLTGITAGAVVQTRADGFFVSIAIVAFLLIANFFAKYNMQKPLFRSTITFIAGAGLSIALAWLDMTVMSKSYYLSHGTLIKIQLALLGAAILLGGAVVWLNRKFGFLNRIKKIRKSTAVFWVPAIMVGGALLLMSRPLWLKGPDFIMSSAIHSAMVLQSKLGLPVEPRSYAESSVLWMNWYIGETLVLLAIGGLVIATIIAIKRNRMAILASVILITLASGAFFLLPKITPDHIWAMRRFVPVIMPGLILFGVFTTGILWEKFKPKSLSANKQVAIGLAVAAFISLPTLITTRPFVRVAEKNSNYESTTQFCNSLPDNAAVLWLEQSTLAATAVQSTRAFCGHPSMVFIVKEGKYILTQEKLSRFANTAIEKGYTPVVAIFSSRESFTPDFIRNNLSPVAVYYHELIERTLTRPPQHVHTASDTIETGIIQPDGTVIGD